jgi:RNA polymerase sigma-70 factor (ECF subfamily)
MNTAPPKPVNSDPQDQEALLVGLRANNPGAYEQLVRQTGGKLLAVARRILGNEADAHEAVQDAFLSAVRAMDTFDGAKASLNTWLHRIAINAALQKLRSKRRKPERSIDDLLPSFAEDGHQAAPVMDWRETSDLAAQRRETRQLVRHAIDQLPDAFREVLLLRDIEGLDTEETAQFLGINAGAVKTRLHRARQALRTLLDPHFRGEQP